MHEVLIILILASTLCAINGSFLVLRQISMIADAISHSVLLGIVLSFFIVRNVDSPFLMVGAAIFGVITVFSVEKISKRMNIKIDDAIGIVYTVFFALAIVLISRFIRNAHIDTEIVLMGEILFQPLNRMDIFGISLPVKMVQLSGLLIVNLLGLILFYRELKISTFNEEYARMSGIKTGIIFYILMFITSINAVVSFDTIGAILVISFMIAPSASSYLVTKDLKIMVLVSVLYGAINSIIGFLISIKFNVSMSGSTALVGMITFLLTVILYKQGIITNILMRKRKKKELYDTVILMHLYNHSQTPEKDEELGIQTIRNHLGWKEIEAHKRLNRLIESGDISINKEKQRYSLTEKGLARALKLRKEYNY